MSFDILTVSCQSDDAPQRFADSLRSTGFALIEDSPIDQALIDEVYKAWQNFFAADNAHKKTFEFDELTHNGFISLDRSETAKGYDQKDLKEMYHLYRGGVCPPEVEELTFKLFDQMLGCAEMLLGWIEQNLPEDVRQGLSEPLSQMIHKSPKNLFRLLHYPPLTGTEKPGAVRAAAHEDINLLTVLPSATAKGLQVLSSEGEWFDVSTKRGRIVINTGDMLDECTGGHFTATKHRVINPENEDASKSRLSMPLFLHPREEVVLSERYTAGSFRAERYKELGLAPENDEDIPT